MSFALSVKEEILYHDLSNDQKKYLLSGFIKYNGKLILANRGYKLVLSSHSNFIIRKIYDISKIFFKGEIGISIIQTTRLKKYKYIELVFSGEVEKFLTDLNIYSFLENKKITELTDEFLKEDDLLKSYVAGVFIAVGSVNSPRTINYHLEFQFKDEESQLYFLKIFKKLGFQFKIISRAKKYICYIKKSMEVSNFINLMGALSSMVKFENTRIERDLSNNINRYMNIDQYNQKKSITKGMEQVREINAIKQNGSFSSLSIKSQKLANLRLENPEGSYNDLADELNYSGIYITKSGVSNLFKIINKLYTSIKN